MATSITTINSTDLITNSRADINNNFDSILVNKMETSVLDTDTTLAANSNSKVATQAAVKAYVDAGGNVNASETTKGIVEEATDAEVAAGTATGGTGAKLFVTPTKLASSKYSTTRSVTAGATITGATLPVPVYQNKTDNEFYACDGNDTAAMKFLGFATSNGTDGAAMNVQFTGIVSGFTGLDEGEKYYLSDTVGTISNTIGTYEVLVGVAISTTELLIQKGKRYRNGAGSFSDAGNDGQTQTSVITLGFRPSIIRMIGYLNNASESIQSSGSWANGVYASAWQATDESGGLITIGTNTSGILYMQDPGTNEQWRITITSVSDTAFTITALQEVNAPYAIHFQWTAEGEL